MVFFVGRWSWLRWAAALLGLMLLGGCSAPVAGTATTKKAPAFAQASYDEADPVIGGQLYDQWWSGQTPSGNGPMVDPTGSTTGNDGESWRCVTCHGWHYNGENYKGLPGTSLRLSRNMGAKKIFDFILNGTFTVGGKQKQHRFTPLLAPVDAYDLTAFIMQEDLGVDPTGGGNIDSGKSQYQSHPYGAEGRVGCESSQCHIVAANKNALIAAASERPQEFLHKVRFGNPTSAPPMPGGVSLPDARNVLAYAKTIKATTPSAPGTTTGGFDATRYNDVSKQTADLIQGGQLYDEWWLATNPPSTPPTSKHPSWPITAGAQVTLAQTWRCSQCHGWDYRGVDGSYNSGENYTGLRGIIQTDKTAPKWTAAADVFAFIKSGTAHSFGEKLADNDIYALTRFVMSQRALHAANKATYHFIDDATLATVGTSETNGGTLYGKTCANGGCHGPLGDALDFADGQPHVGEDEFVDTVAKDNPWEMMHKVLYGIPGSSPAMPALTVAASDLAGAVAKAADIVAYAQTSLVPDLKRGGRLYDKWWDENGAVSPTTDQPLWATRSKNASGVFDNAVSGEDSWRCKECHGWDYKGVAGAYATGSHKTGFPGILNRSRNSLSLIDQFIRSGTNHSFFGTNKLGERDMKDLVAFIMSNTEGVTDVTNALSGGSSTVGKTLYEDVTPGDCKGCHGAQGTTVGSVDVGALANDNPQEFVHKARFGSPGSTMIPTPGGFIGLNVTQAGDARAYAKTLSVSGPTAPSYATARIDRGGRLFDEWWTEMAATEPTTANPLWATRNAAVPALPTTDPISKTWRCSTCHDWNYRGVGFFRTNGSVTSKDNLLDLRSRYVPAVFATDTELQTYIYNWIKLGNNSGKHNYAIAQTGIVKPLGEAELWDLTKFLIEGVVNTNNYISNLGGITTADLPASILNGESIYNGAKLAKVNCASCHGGDGLKTPPLSTAVLDILDVAKNEATEFFHKVRFGQPGTAMPAMTGVTGVPDLNTANREARDVLGYAQDLYCKRAPKPTGC